ncbi:MAG: hypothetical protein M3P27_04905 [Acidobacteriota bacterium]|nr:hypothetical protein [Acidobacteriota bacterium]
MGIIVERNNFSADDGRFQYYVGLKPNVSKDELEVQTRVPVEVAVSVSENGDLVDLAFELPKKWRSDQALTFIKRQHQANYVDPRVFIAFTGVSGDVVMAAPANLEIDAAGRIIGLDIH